MAKTKKEVVKATQVAPTQDKNKNLEVKANEFMLHLSNDFQGEKIKVKLICPQTEIFTTANGLTHTQEFDNLDRHRGFKDLVSYLKIFGELEPEEMFSLEWTHGDKKIVYEWKGADFAPKTNTILKRAVKYSLNIGLDGKLITNGKMLKSDYKDEIKDKFNAVVAVFLERQSLAEAVPMIKFLEDIDKKDLPKLSLFVGSLLPQFFANKKKEIDAESKEAKLIEIYG